MARKEAGAEVFYIGLGALLFAGLSIMPISALMAKQGFSNRDKSWASGLAYKGARIRMRMQQYRTSARILEKALEVFPKYKDVDRAHYWIGLCYERSDQAASAVKWDKIFLEKWPSHMWVSQAKRRVAELEAKDL